jgi:hypothetical protein
MPMDKKGPQQKVAKKVKAVSMKDLNPDGTLKVRTNAEMKAEHKKEQIEKAQKEKKAREEATQKMQEEIRQKEIEVTKKRLAAEAKADKTVETLTMEDGPQTIASCVAKALGHRAPPPSRPTPTRARARTRRWRAAATRAGLILRPPRSAGAQAEAGAGQSRRDDARRRAQGRPAEGAADAVRGRAGGAARRQARDRDRKKRS